MTAQLSREWLQKTISDIEKMRDEIPFGLDEDERNTLSALKLALAAMDSKPVTTPDYPETLPCPVALEPGLRFGKGIPTKTMLDALQRRAEYYAELDAMTPEQRAEHDAGMKELAAMFRGTKPATGDFRENGNSSTENFRENTQTSTSEPVSQRYTLPPHIYRELVNQLRDTAVKYQGCQQLREQISATLRTVIVSAEPDKEKV